MNYKNILLENRKPEVYITARRTAEFDFLNVVDNACVKKKKNEQDHGCIVVTT